MKVEYEIDQDPDGDYHLRAYYREDLEFTRKVGHEVRTTGLRPGQLIDCAYIEPCGGVPDGMWIPMRKIEWLLEHEVIAPHERDDEYESMGIGFDPVGGGDSDEEDANITILMRLEV